MCNLNSLTVMINEYSPPRRPLSQALISITAPSHTLCGATRADFRNVG